MNATILNSIDEASKVIGKTWPLYTFVASNPLSGYENAPFEDALLAAKTNLSTNPFPSSNLYRQAWERGEIKHHILKAQLEAHMLFESPEYYLGKLEAEKPAEEINSAQEIDRIMAKWLSAFLDEGLAEWDMPFKTEGFYTAWRHLAIYDSEIGTTSLHEIPKTSEAALEFILEQVSGADTTALFTKHLAALPGWTGYINYRSESNSAWQQDFPISLQDYLAVRLWTCWKLNIPLIEEQLKKPIDNAVFELQYIWLKAWEESWQDELLTTLENESIATPDLLEEEIPEAQFVFCIDTRSELIRRHVESKGNYETFGYAGFFGIAMDYESLNDGITRKSCPPIVTSAYKVSETPKAGEEKAFATYQKKTNTGHFENYFLRRMKNMLPSAFGYVEGSGVFYGINMLGKTLLSRTFYKRKQRNNSLTETLCQPGLNKVSPVGIEASTKISLEEKVGIVKSAFDLMGWKRFSPLVLFVGHGSHSENNPFSSSLDCGACAASPGRHNARMLAKLANLKEVRHSLLELHGIEIPKKTVFIGAEHNTTTDAIILFDAEVPSSHRDLVQKIKINLDKSQRTATQDRLGKQASGVAAAQKNASNWSETRPEWGLAKNAGFIIGPRSLTKNSNLGSRCFLHSYNWELDTNGTALEGIMQGPMVVTQWINNHYYFSTVDNNTYGGGTKITHNITGKFGVVQGNGGDLKMGLPLQSLFGTDDKMYHQPLRLSVMIQAPIARVSEILARNRNLMTLLDNEWIYLMVMDPTHKNEIFKYKKSIQWVSNSSNRSSEVVRNKKEQKQPELANI